MFFFLHFLPSSRLPAPLHRLSDRPLPRPTPAPLRAAANSFTRPAPPVSFVQWRAPVPALPPPWPRRPLRRRRRLRPPVRHADVPRRRQHAVIVPTPTPAAYVVAAAAASSPGRTVRRPRSTFPAVRRRMPAPPPALPPAGLALAPLCPAGGAEMIFFIIF